MTTTTNNHFHLRSFRPSGDDVTVRFTATLAYGKIAVAKVSGESGRTMLVDVEALNAYYWEQFEAHARRSLPDDDEDTEPAVSLLMAMADEAYHSRRLQVTSLRFTAYRLRGDPPGAFRYLRGRPYDLETEGELRLTFGRRLEAVYRRGRGAEALPAAVGC